MCDTGRSPNAYSKVGWLASTTDANGKAASQFYDANGNTRKSVARKGSISRNAYGDIS
ncbi:MAG: hypothetical protein HYY93_06315 [Planctomycetes bacterium]|nr:hypothetical protein [Planctomycetota bacterium]